MKLASPRKLLFPKKKKTTGINKSIVDILPIVDYDERHGCFQLKNGEYFDIEYREDKGDRTENGMTIFDSAIPDNYELLKVIPIIDLNLFKGKDITFGLLFRPTIKEIINEK